MNLMRILIPAAAAMLALGLSGCGSVSAYRPSPQDAAGLTPYQARKQLLRAAMTMAEGGCMIHPAKVTYESLGCVRGKKNYRYADYPSLVAMTYVADPVEGHGADKSCINDKESSIHRGTGEGRWDNKDCLFYSAGAHPAEAREFVLAWGVLARDGAAFARAQDASFEKAAQSYRDAPEKPALPEEAVRFKVQAEQAVQQKRFAEAADLYEEGLEVAPAWPAGHYNRGLVLGELQSYEAAIAEMKRYLKLEPDADNARAVQLKIYAWEGLVTK
jgi:tetratricopeptide (TPR) repeat protein